MVYYESVIPTNIIHDTNFVASMQTATAKNTYRDDLTAVGETERFRVPESRSEFEHHFVRHAERVDQLLFSGDPVRIKHTVFQDAGVVLSDDERHRLAARFNLHFRALFFFLTMFILDRETANERTVEIRDHAFYTEHLL